MLEVSVFFLRFLSFFIFAFIFFICFLWLYVLREFLILFPLYLIFVSMKGRFLIKKKNPWKLVSIFASLLVQVIYLRVLVQWLAIVYYSLLPLYSICMSNVSYL